MLGTARARAEAVSARSESAEDRLHVGAWLTWLLVVSAFAFLTSNPLYLSLALIASGGVYLNVRETAKGRALTPFVLLGLALALLSVPFNVLTGSSGDTRLAELPAITFPDWFGGVTLGGKVTAEALVGASGRAMSIATLVAAAAAFNSAVDHFRLLRLAPRGLSQVMLIFTVAALTVPQAMAQARAIAEARRLRGHRARGLRALPALTLPVLQGALERAVQRAESMDARGFGGGSRTGSGVMTAAGVAGLGAAVWGAFTHFYDGPGIVPSLAMAAGAGLVIVALYRGQRRKANFIRVAAWSTRAQLLAASAAISFLLVLGLRVSGAGDAGYLAYPDVMWPEFHWAGAVAAVLLLTPAFLSGSEDEQSRGTLD